MRIRESKTGKPEHHNSVVEKILNNYDVRYLKETIARISIPRHFQHEARNNKQVAAWIEREFQRFGLHTERQGKYENIVATMLDDPAQARVLIGAHYDSVPKTPGADDNASAVAGMLAAAKALSSVGPLPIVYVAFNREEDGMLGSRDFVESYLLPRGCKLEAAHILEMIGYCDKAAGSQATPAGLPVNLGDTADFIGILMNDASNLYAASLIATAEKYVADLPVKTLEIFDGMEHHLPDLLRSDHSSFWNAGLPALMWTDTSEFRNPHYHQAGDTPETLDYGFIKKVTDLLVLQCLETLDGIPPDRSSHAS